MVVLEASLCWEQAYTQRYYLVGQGGALYYGGVKDRYRTRCDECERPHTPPVAHSLFPRLEHGAIGIVCGKLWVEKGEDVLERCSAPVKTAFC